MQSRALTLCYSGNAKGLTLRGTRAVEFDFASWCQNPEQIVLGNTRSASHHYQTFFLEHTAPLAGASS